MPRSILISVFLLGVIDLCAGGQPEFVEQKPQYIRTRELPALKISFPDMQSILEKAANLLSNANVNAPRKKEFFFRETLTLGKESDQIEIAGHSFPADARLPKVAYPLSYFYSWTDAPVSKLQLDLRDSWTRLTVSGTAVDQVEAITDALERDLLQHAAAAEQPELIEQKPEYSRTRELPSLKISSTDMQSVLEDAASLLSNANRDEGKKPKDIYLSETLRLGTGPDEIKIAGHTFPENARVPKVAYALSYSYSWSGAPVSSVELDLRDYGNTLRVAGPAVAEVDAISAALERDLSHHSSLGGATLRGLLGYVTFLILVVSLFISGAYCISERQWRFLGIPFFSLVGLLLLFTLPFRDAFAGFALYEGEPSWIVRYQAQLGLGLTIAGIVLSFFVPMRRDARRKKNS
jgi:hypothetical protein